MTSHAAAPPSPAPEGQAELLAQELATEQLHLDRVQVQLDKASQRAAMVQAEGMSRGQTHHTGSVRIEEATGLFERDALVLTALRRQQLLDQNFEGLVFGRLDLQPTESPDPQALAPRYIGRLGVRDEDYEPLVVDWRAPAAAPFYQATPANPLGVVRRRVLTCRGEKVVGIEDDLLVAEAPEGMAVVGEGALLAALTRSRSGRMRDIVATIQSHQDRAIRAPAQGVAEITGGPGTGKTVVALHRVAYLLYADRQRYESGGVLVVGPSAAYTAYIERVLPSLGEDSVALRSLGELVDGVSATRVDTPEVAAIKGSLRMRKVLAAAAKDGLPGAPEQLRVFVMGVTVRLDRRALTRARNSGLRGGRLRNASADAVAEALAELAWAKAELPEEDRSTFARRFLGHAAVEEYLGRWCRPVDPREVLLWLADSDRAAQYGAGVLSAEETTTLATSYQQTLAAGTWSVADAPLIEELATRLGPVPEAEREREFFQVEGLADEEDEGPDSDWEFAAEPEADPLRRQLLRGRVEVSERYAHVLVDEAQDLSPMQWTVLARRGQWASWTIVGDAAQASWTAPEEAATAREEAFGHQVHQHFHLDTNYRNSAEIFGYAERVIRAELPDADIPNAVRETGIEPVEVAVAGDAAAVAAAVTSALTTLTAAVEGAVAVVTPARWQSVAQQAVAAWAKSDLAAERVSVIDPLSTKGLEWDATVVLDPDEIRRTAPGGVRVLYVCLTRAAHRMHVLHVG